MNDLCTVCRRPLVPDEKALSRKLVNRGTEKFWCLTCLAEHFEVTEEDLKRKIREFRTSGCTLFEPDP